MTHTCIKISCGKQYESDEEEAYYCPSCVEQKEALARQIDAKVGPSTNRSVRTALQEYDEGEKAHGFLRVKL